MVKMILFIILNLTVYFECSVELPLWYHVDIGNAGAKTFKTSGQAFNF